MQPKQMKRIFLIGYMGAGKTTVGKDLAQRGGLSFVDLDHAIEARYHKTVREIFQEKGEEGFREIERKMLAEVSTFEDVVISTGGGAPCFYGNMEFMNSVGTTVYLKVSVDELVARLEPCKHTRPVLQGRSGEDLKTFNRENIEKREAHYLKASIVFEAETMLTETDVENISKALLNLL